MLMRLELTVLPNVLTAPPATILPLRAKFFRGLADPSRLAILEVLRTGPATVGALVEQTGLTQPNTSTHLACLLGCGLVQRERQGKFMRYQLADERVAALLALADEVLSDHFDQLAACARYDSGEERA
jgi:DNA-binding transcriptional ArsR family regulator